MIAVLSPTEAKYFSSSLCVHTGTGAHPASYPMDNGSPILGGKRGRGVTLTSHLHLEPTSGMTRGWRSSPLGACMEVAGHLYFYCPVQQWANQGHFVKQEQCYHQAIPWRRRYRQSPKHWTFAPNWRSRSSENILSLLVALQPSVLNRNIIILGL
jgi:hypothetical protein